MEWYFKLLIGFGILVFIIVLIKIFTRKKNNEDYEDNENSGSFWDKVKDACCTKN